MCIDPSKVVDLARTALHQCVLPRALLSVPDAIYAARFALLTHALGTHKFSSLAFLDKTFEDVAATVFSCTSNEAHCYGTHHAHTVSDRTIAIQDASAVIWGSWTRTEGAGVARRAFPGRAAGNHRTMVRQRECLHNGPSSTRPLPRFH